MKNSMNREVPGLLSLDASLRITLVDPIVSQLLEYSESDLIGKKIDTIFPNLNSETIFVNHLELGSAASMSLSALTKSGKLINLSVDLSSVATKQDSETFLCIYSEMQKPRKTQMEKEILKIRDVLDLNTDGWWNWNLKNQAEEYLSPGFKKLFGYEDHELENSSETWMKLIFQEDLEIATANLKKHLESDGEIPYHQKVRYRHKDGSTVWVICKGVAIKDENGEFDRMVGIHFDITENIELEQQLIKANFELKAKNEELEQFVYTISHDLKSPIVTCMSFLAFLKEDLEARKIDAVFDSVDEIDKGLAKLRELINDLLELSCAGQLDLNLEKISPIILIQEIADQLIDRDKNKAINVKVSSDIPDIVGDVTRISQVFENLLTNAIKYSGSNVVNIDVFSEIEDGKVRICFKDNGYGIDAKYHEKIFELFQRLDPNQDGTGVGLTIVKRIMEMHKGSVTVRSTIGQGSEFWLDFLDLRGEDVKK